MRQLNISSVLPALAVLILVGGAPTLQAQTAVPSKAKGVAAKAAASLELGPQFQGRYLRARMVTLEPGGHTGLHGHKDRPVIVYVLQGTMSTCKPEGTCMEVSERQAEAEGKDSGEVWHANRGTKPAVVLVVDISEEP